jgi:hypothetical protein
MKNDLELKENWTPKQLDKWKRCDSCGNFCQSKKLRPDDSGGYSIFCKDCIEEGRAISRMTPKERSKYLHED